MGKASLIAGNVEAGFRAYALAGGNVPEAARILRRDGIELTERTVRTWAGKYDFKRRLVNADALLLAETRGVQKTMISFLLLQCEQYVTYFQSLRKPDTQATHAFNNLLKTLVGLLPEQPKAGLSHEELMRESELMLEYEFGIHPPQREKKANAQTR